MIKAMWKKDSQSGRKTCLPHPLNSEGNGNMIKNQQRKQKVENPGVDTHYQIMKENSGSK